MALDGWMYASRCYDDASLAMQSWGSNLFIQFPDGNNFWNNGGVFANVGTPTPGTGFYGIAGLKRFDAVDATYSASFNAVNWFAPCEVDVNNILNLTVSQGTEIGLAILLACAIAWGVRKLADVLQQEERD